MNTHMLKLIACTALAMAGNFAQADDVASVSPAQLAQERIERQSYRALLDAVMLREGRDRAWATDVEGRIRASLDTVRKLDVSVRDIECATTLCRVILDHATLSGQDQVLGATAGMPGFDLAGRAHLEWGDDGSVVTYIYLLRFDTDWPEVLAH